MDCVFVHVTSDGTKATVWGFWGDDIRRALLKCTVILHISLERSLHYGSLFCF